MDLAFALPTLSVVLGSLFGGGGGGAPLPPEVETEAEDEGEGEGFKVAPRGRVEKCLCCCCCCSCCCCLFMWLTKFGTVTTVSLTTSPDLRIRPTTVSWLAVVTSLPLICKQKNILVSHQILPGRRVKKYFEIMVLNSNFPPLFLPP